MKKNLFTNDAIFYWRGFSGIPCRLFRCYFPMQNLEKMREDGGQAAFPVHVPGTLKTGTSRNLFAPATSMHGPSVLASLLCWL